VKASFLSADIQKDSLLANEPSPRIILVGGSSLAYGINSQLLKDSLVMNPINTGLDFGLGIKYMLDNTFRYVKEGDIIILAPEYQQFYQDWDHGGENLLRLVWEINRSKIRLLSWKQMFHCAPYLGTLVRLKFTIILSVIQDHMKKVNQVYTASNFNQYGDMIGHWNQSESKEFTPAAQMLVSDYNPAVVKGILKLSRKMEGKGAKVFVTYPGYQDISFDISKEAIKKVEAEYFANELSILGTPERYRMPDSLMFDTPYHLIKEGVDLRTKLVIEDIKYALAPPPSVQAKGD
jgi:hypothetical protein